MIPLKSPIHLPPPPTTSYDTTKQQYNTIILAMEIRVGHAMTGRNSYRDSLDPQLSRFAFTRNQILHLPLKVS